MFLNSTIALDETNGIQDKLDIMKCGLIFYTNCEFVYQCAFCDEEYQNNEELIAHVTGEHFLNKVGDEVDSLENQESKLSEQVWNHGDDHYSLISYSPEKSDGKEGLPVQHYQVDLDNFKVGEVTKLKIEPITEETDPTNDSYAKPETTPLSSGVISINKDEILNSDIVFINHGTIIHQCSYCLKQFQSKVDFDKHKSIHENSKELICQEASCSKTFTSEAGYYHHMATHRAGKQHKCKFCSKFFNYNCNLKVHIKRYHTLEKPFKCQYCDKRFFISSDKQLHERTHTGERPFVCEICGQDFIAQAKLKNHRKKHKEALIYPCKQCDKIFTSPNELWKHSLTHNTENKFDCIKCGKNFKDHKTLRVHSQTHSDFKYVCTICEKSFQRNSCLHFHMKTHHY